MKKIASLLAFLAIMATTGTGVRAWESVSIPEDYDFEAYANGADWFGETGTGWNKGSINDIAMVTNLEYYYTNSSGLPLPRPLPSSTHSNVLYYETATDSGGISNIFDQVSSNVYIDVMLKMGAVEEPDSSTLIRNATNAETKVAVYVDTNGYLNIWRRSYPNVPYSYDYSNSWLKLYNNPVGSDEWVRVTIHIDNLSDAGNSHRYFRLKLNGGSYFTNELAFSDDCLTGSSIDAAQGGQWFVCANEDRSYLSSINFDGRGSVDDLRVQFGEPPADANDAPGIAITNANGMVVGNAVTSTDIGGNSTNIVGTMRWTNLLTTAGNTFAQANSFTISAIGLNEGTNDIVVYGTNVSGTVVTDMVAIVRQFPATENPPFVDITSTNATVSHETTAYGIAGTNNAEVVGTMWWTNSIGTNGTLDAAASWSISDIGLEVGDNDITVYGSNVTGTVTSDWVRITRIVVDVDADGIPNWWEDKYFPGTGCDPAVDSDGDFASNFAEYIAGTDPTDKLSRFTIIGKGIVNGSNYIDWIGGTNTFPSVPYRIDTLTNMNNPGGWYTNFAGVPRTFGTNRWYTPAPSDRTYFYRLAAPTN